MGSRYFDWTTSLKRFIRFDAARAEDVNDALDELSAGLEQLDGDVNRALKLPPGAPDQTLSLSAGARANKVLAFDASGNITVTATDVDGIAANAASAAASASAAATSAGQAATSASAANASATNAANSAGAAATSASNAASSASAASSSATSASNSATTATTQAGIATTQAGIATTQASNASASAASASTSATNAANSASAAAASASSAASSASSAASSAASAESSFDQFDDRYLGSKSSPPNLDNDGQPLLTGALYWDTSMQRLRIYNGVGWQNVAETVTSISAAQINDSTAIGRAVLTASSQASAANAIGLARASGVTYTYDSQGRVSSMSETLPSGTRTTTLTYDAQGRVSTAAVTQGSTTRTTTYSYDSAGRLTGLTVTES